MLTCRTMLTNVIIFFWYIERLGIIIIVFLSFFYEPIAMKFRVNGYVWNMCGTKIFVRKIRPLAHPMAEFKSNLKNPFLLLTVLAFKGSKVII